MLCRCSKRLSRVENSINSIPTTNANKIDACVYSRSFLLFTCSLACFLIESQPLIFCWFSFRHVFMFWLIYPRSPTSFGCTYNVPLNDAYSPSRVVSRSKSGQADGGGTGITNETLYFDDERKNVHKKTAKQKRTIHFHYLTFNQ